MSARSGPIALFSVVLALAGCATSTHVIVGNTRAPTSPADVRIYLQPPARYEEIAVISAQGRPSWAITSQQQADVAMERLKEEAASLGANGILFEGMGDRYNGTLTSNFVSVRGLSVLGLGASLSSYIKEAKGVAIYADDDQVALTEPTPAPPVPTEVMAAEEPPAVATIPTVMVNRVDPRAVQRALGATFGPNDQGLSVLSVEKGGPAARADLKRGDVITEINGRQLAPLYWKNAEALLTNAGDTVRIEVFGKGERTLSLQQ